MQSVLTMGCWELLGMADLTARFDKRADLCWRAHLVRSVDALLFPIRANVPSLDQASTPACTINDCACITAAETQKLSYKKM